MFRELKHNVGLLFQYPDESAENQIMGKQIIHHPVSGIFQLRKTMNSKTFNDLHCHPP